MILQALKEYYDRKAADPDSGIAPLGWYHNFHLRRAFCRHSACATPLAALYGAHS